MPVCLHCYRSFVDKNALRMHTESKHPTYDCTYCNRTFKSSEGRDQHENSKHNYCKTCDRKFRNQEALFKHSEVKHQHKCTYCDKAFMSFESRAQHELLKHAYSLRRASTVYSPSHSYSLRSSKAQVIAPEPVANFACGTCGERVATIVALEAHESQKHLIESCTCQICERAGRPCTCSICERAGQPCTCSICKRANTLTVLVEKDIFVDAVSCQSEEPRISGDSLGTIEPEAVKDSSVDSRNQSVALESEEEDVVDSTVHVLCDFEDDAMDTQDERSLPDLKCPVVRKLSHDLTCPHPTSPPDCEHDSSTCQVSEAAMDLREEQGIRSHIMRPNNSMDVLEKMSPESVVINSQTVVQKPTVHECTCPSEPDLLLDLNSSETRGCSMSPPVVSNDHPTILDMDMSHGQIDIDHSPECDPCALGLEHNKTSLLHATVKSLAGSTLPSVDSVVKQVCSPHCIKSPQDYTAQLKAAAESGDHFTCVPSPTPSETGSLRSSSINEDGYIVPESRAPPSPSTSEGSDDGFSDINPSSTLSSPLSEHSIVFVSADSIPEYLRENRAYLVATSAPSRPSTAASSYMQLPSVSTSLDSLPPQEDQNDDVEASVAHSPANNRPPRLYCRVCLRDPCDDITATMCGHIFCHRCIIDAVMARSACPVCNAPTLLYCLFRLDFSC